MGAVTEAEVVDVGEKRDKRGHRIVPAAERARLVAAYQASGLTMAAFARREGMNYAAGWIYKVARPSPSVKPIAFAQVRLPAPPATSTDSEDKLEVQLPDGTLLRGRSAAELAALIRALRS